MECQVPLTAHRMNARVGKIDIFDLNDACVPVVIELKVLGQNKADTPLRALVEALVHGIVRQIRAPSASGAGTFCIC